MGTPGCGLVEVGGGTFSMGGDPGDYGASLPIQPAVRVSSFAMDAYEVTVARFRAFWNARRRDGAASIRRAPVAYPRGRSIVWGGQALEPDIPFPGSSSVEFSTWTRTPGAFEAHPITPVSWWTAMEFCVWDGGRLPTEAEWEYAARGRVVRCEGLRAGRVFPWGDEVPPLACSRAQFRGCAGRDGRASVPVGTFAATGGIHDLAGNVSEWVADDFARFSYAPCWSGRASQDPLCQVAGEGYRGMRGGSFFSVFDSLRPASRGGTALVDSYLGGGVGFRCVRSL